MIDSSGNVLKDFSGCIFASAGTASNSYSYTISVSVNGTVVKSVSGNFYGCSLSVKKYDFKKGDKITVSGSVPNTEGDGVVIIF